MRKEIAIAAMRECKDRQELESVLVAFHADTYRKRIFLLWEEDKELEFEKDESKQYEDLLEKFLSEESQKKRNLQTVKNYINIYL